MLWETILPKSLTGEAAQPAQDAVLRAGLAMDSDAFAGFYERSARGLWAYLARVSGDPALADDLVQESFVRFLTAARSPLVEEGEIAGRRYLFRIGSNLLRDHWRRPRTTSIEEVPEEFFSTNGADDTYDEVAALTPALNQMKPRERQLLWLAHAEGYSHKEIAEVTGLASASIRLLLFRARHKIAKLLREAEQPVAESNVRRLP
ncbi:RNA polymerase sigma factor [Acidicapsa dinghuensis]|uniref:RNA polymerase sigma factor n=1 Tax=Acidicapsa dinghuensis TaxID=2218256 RepID=A0ABW1EJX6_9BACT|nr:RNA polymerase sigma factor [Acidicapsa dinghuensis]